MECVPADHDPIIKVHYCVYGADLVYRSMDRLRAGESHHRYGCQVLHRGDRTLEHAGKGKHLPVVYPVCRRCGLCIHPNCCIVPVYAALLHRRTDRSGEGVNVKRISGAAERLL